MNEPDFRTRADKHGDDSASSRQQATYHENRKWVVGDRVGSFLVVGCAAALGLMFTWITGESGPSPGLPVALAVISCALFMLVLLGSVCSLVGTVETHERVARKHTDISVTQSDMGALLQLVAPNTRAQIRGNEPQKYKTLQARLEKQILRPIYSGYRDSDNKFVWGCMKISGNLHLSILILGLLYAAASTAALAAALIP